MWSALGNSHNNIFSRLEAPPPPAPPSTFSLKDRLLKRFLLLNMRRFPRWSRQTGTVFFLLFFKPNQVVINSLLRIKRALRKSWRRCAYARVTFTCQLARDCSIICSAAGQQQALPLHVVNAHHNVLKRQQQKKEQKSIVRIYWQSWWKALESNWLRLPPFFSSLSEAVNFLFRIDYA